MLMIVLFGETKKLSLNNEINLVSKYCETKEKRETQGKKK